MAFQLDSSVKELLKWRAAAGRPEIETLDPEAARRLYLETAATVAGEPTPVASVVDRAIPGPASDIGIRIYRPSRPICEPPPVAVYYHGGGWVIGDLASHDNVCRWLCEKSGVVVVAVDYRRAPEHKFPAAVEDAHAALAWVAHNAAEIEVDANRLAVAGDSAGGNLAAVAAIAARDAGGPALRFQLLVYPATDLTASFPSHEENGDGYILTRSAIKWFSGHYLRQFDDARDPRASPLFAANHRNLPPALIFTAGFDPLRDEGEAYAEILRKAGNQVDYFCFEGMVHAFFNMPGVLPTAREALDRAASALRAALGAG